MEERRQVQPLHRESHRGRRCGHRVVAGDLSHWLSIQGQAQHILHPCQQPLGLQRAAAVAVRAQLTTPLDALCPLSQDFGEWDILRPFWRKGYTQGHVPPLAPVLRPCLLAAEASRPFLPVHVEVRRQLTCRVWRRLRCGVRSFPHLRVAQRFDLVRL